MAYRVQIEVIGVQYESSYEHQGLLLFFYYYYTGTPNDQMFPNTPEVYQMVFVVLQKPVGIIWSCPKNYFSLRMSQANFGRHESFRWLFRLIRKCVLGYPCASGRKYEDMKQPCFHSKISGDVLSLHRKFQETFF